ncbi:MAG TPA: maltose alpha-D-glucosyltransferase [Anaerolineales bacterium]
MNQALWYKDAIFYQVYLRAFKDSNGDGQGDLKGLASKLDYLKDLGIDCIWLMPIYPSPLKDDGYDIADFYQIAEVYGGLDDFKLLLQALHARGMRLIMDLVMNHTSDQHPWFQAARSDPRSPYRDYYVWSNDPNRYREARIIFLDVEPSNWTWDEQAGQFYWHRFYASQPDLNYDNPGVQEEMLNVARFWLGLGIDGFRADAVPYLFESEGTNCENLPETHDYLKRVRRMMDQEFPGRILLCEANQPPEDVRRYFGDADEFQMGFHFPIMPRLFMALKKGRSDDLREILLRTPAIPQECQWCTFLRNHDELTLEMVTPEERAWMWEQYSPEPRMRLNLGIRRRLAPLLDNDARKIKLINSLLLSLPGSPIIYYGDEIGMGDNIWLPDRNGVRTPMQWTAGRNAGFSDAQPDRLYSPIIETDDYGPRRVNVAGQQSDPASLWNVIRHMLHTRKRYPTFGWGSLEWLDTGNDRLAVFRRRFENQSILAVHNLSDSTESLSVTIRGGAPQARDLLTEGTYGTIAGSLRIQMAPFQSLWLEGV